MKTRAQALADVKALREKISRQFRDKDDIGGWYEQRREEAEALRRLKDSGPWDPQAIRVLDYAIERALYVGD